MDNLFCEKTQIVLRFVLSEKKREHLEKLRSLVGENDNNYILYGRLRSDFKEGRADEALLIYDETQWKK